MNSRLWTAYNSPGAAGEIEADNKAAFGELRSKRPGYGFQQFGRGGAVDVQFFRQGRTVRDVSHTEIPGEVSVKEKKAPLKAAGGDGGVPLESHGSPAGGSFKVSPESALKKVIRGFKLPEIYGLQGEGR